MSSELAKTISTASIWVSACVTLTWGVCRMNGWEGIILLAIVAVVMLGATIATVAIWAPWAMKSMTKEDPRRGFEVTPLPGAKS